MKIIVTGGAGFIGSNFIYYMMEKYPGGSDHLSGCTDLCRTFVNTGTGDEKSTLSVCESIGDRPGGSVPVI